jgi:methionine-rich copper-binding protein CopC
VPVSASNVLADPATEPAEEGILSIKFVDTVGLAPATTDYFSTYVIDAESIGATVTAYDIAGETLYTESVTDKGYASQYFVEVVQNGIYEVVITLGSGTDTSALDNICWATPNEILLPDIALSNLNTDAQGWGGTRMDVHLDVSNTGNSILQPGWDISYYLSDDDTFDELSDTLCTTSNVDIQIGVSQTVSFDSIIILPDNISGDKYLIAVADIADTVVEFPDQDNNIAVSSVISTATDHDLPTVISQYPDGLTPQGTSSVTVEFSEAIAADTFTAAQISITDPDSAAVTVNDVQNTEGNKWEITFANLMDTGTYTLTISSVVSDPAGNYLDGNGDGTPSLYTGTFEVTTEPIQSNLSGWTKHGNSGNGNWNVAADGLSVLQTINGNPTFFISDFDLTDSSFQGTFAVETSSDDDYIGFVFGFNDNDGNPSTLDSPFYLLSWKQTNQSHTGYGEAGFKVVKVTDPVNYNYWDVETSSYGTVLHRLTESDKGWRDYEVYEFFLSYQPLEGQIRVIVNRESDGVELYNTGLLTDPEPIGTGRVGFYNYSQASVRYAGFSSAVLQPPVAVPGEGYFFDASGTDVTLDATGSYDQDNQQLGFDAITSVQWDIGNDGIGDDAERVNAAETLTLQQAKDKGLSISSDLEVALTVTDADALTGTAVTTVTYQNALPLVDAGSEDYGTVSGGQSIELLGSVTDADLAVDVGDALAYEWDTSPAANAGEIGDGFSVELTPTLDYNTLFSLLGAGSGTLYLNAVDSSGTVVTDSAAIAVEVVNLTVTTAHGTASPPEGTNVFIPDSEISCTVNSPVTQGTTRYLCSGWTGTGSVPATGAGNDTGIIVLAVDSSITWNWDTEYYLNTAAAGGGSVDVPDGWHPQGDVITINAQADAFHHFTGWSGDTAGAVIDGEQITVTMDQPRSITANFEIDTYTVTFQAGEHGQITAGLSEQTVDHGSSAVPPTITADSDWAFVGWDVDYTNITADVTITAQYLPAYTVTFQAGDHGEITGGNAVQTIAEGGSATAPTVTAFSGWVFTGWDASFTNITSDLTVTAQYSGAELGLTAETDEVREDTTTPNIRCVVSRNGSFNQNLTVSIVSSDTSEITVPASVSIPSGQTSAAFFATVLNDGLLDGDQTAVITVSAGGYLPADASILVIDTEKPTLSIQMPQMEAYEGDIFTATLNSNYPAVGDTVVYLQNTPAGQLDIPAAVTILDGEQSALFDVVVIDDDVAEQDGNVEIRANNPSYNPATATLFVYDDDVPGAVLTIAPQEASEGAGFNAAVATVTRTEPDMSKPVNIQLTADVPNALILPTGVSIPTGQASANFMVGTLDNGMVDGERIVMISGKVLVASCGCALDPSSGVPIEAGITILDDDGPTLKVTPNPATMAENRVNAGVLRITHNLVELTEDLTVSISHDRDDEISVASTAVIPAGEPGVDVPVETLDDGIEDGSQMVSIYVDAAGYTSGTAWLLVSDQNLADLSISNIQILTDVITGEDFDFSFELDNIGLWDSPAGIGIKVYYSTNNNISTDKLLNSYVTLKTVPQDGSITVTLTAPAPEATGNYKLIIVADSEKILTELNEGNNIGYSDNFLIQPAYSAVTQTDVVTAIAPQPIPIYGTATMADGVTPAANVPLDVYTVVGGMRRTISAVTDEYGDFYAEFVPLPGEKGHYGLGACYPGMNSYEEQDSFELLGIKRTTSTHIIWDMTVGDVKDGVIGINNPSYAGLTGLSAQAVNLPDNCQLQLSVPSSLPGGSTASINYTVTATGVSEGNDYHVITVRVTSAEGVTFDIPCYYFAESVKGYLKAEPTTLSTTMNRIEPRLVEFKVRNDGSGESGMITIDVPNASWMRLISPKYVESIPGGSSTTATLELFADDSVPFNAPINGSIAINADNANSVVLPFSFEAVSSETGSILIDVVDEYTYYVEGEPHLEGAQVKIKNPYTGELLHEGLTDVNGIYQSPELPIGKYSVSVTADKHAGWQNFIEVVPGTVTDELVFLQYQSITYTWDVKRTEIEDQYDVELIVDFETNVPAPVITIQAPSEVPQLNYGEEYIFNVVVTNHGLINALDVELTLPTVETYLFEALVTDIPVLPAKSNIVVPVRMSRVVSDMKMASPEDYMPCTMAILAAMEYLCGPEYREVYESSNNIRFLGHLCDLLSMLGGGIGGGTGGGGTPSRGGGTGTASGGYSTPTVGSTIDGCEAIKCIDSLLGLNPFIGAGGTGVGIGSNLANGNYGGAAWEATKPFIPHYDKLELLKNCLAMKSSKERLEKALKAAGASDIEQSIIDAEKIVDAMIAMRELQYYIIGTDAWEDELFDGFLELLAGSMDPVTYIIPPENEGDLTSYAELSEAVSAGDVAYTIERWNRSVEYWNLGYQNALDVPAGLNDDFIEPDVMEQTMQPVNDADQYAVSRGFAGLADMEETQLIYIRDYVEQGTGNVCAVVSLRINQRITITREAFEGTLSLYNGNLTTDMTDIQLDLVVRDEDGNISTDLFEISTQSLDVMTGIDGTGSLAPDAEGTAVVLFIPEYGAAPEFARTYYFGGILSYTDPFSGEHVEVDLFPVALEVQPSPQLYLDYFLQRDVYADDPFTDIIEPILPAEMAVLVVNKGYGVAKNFRIDSAQPEIFENEKGLMIDFALLDYNLEGAALNGLPSEDGLSQVNLGDIEAQSSAVAQWWLTSTLQGHFIGMQASFVHLNSSGNPDISLIKEVDIHELIRSVVADDDDLPDFLVTELNVNDLPDTIYFSDGQVADVAQVQGTADNIVPGIVSTVDITVTANAGWQYIWLPDPGNGDFEIVGVTRSDGSELPLTNCWLTDRTMPDGGDTIYEDKLHIFDGFPEAGTEVYTIELIQKDANPPEVAEFLGIEQNDIVNTMPSINVVFSEAIDPATFSYHDLMLRYQGQLKQLSSVVITQIDDVTFNLDLSGIDFGDGYYLLTVQAAGIQDTFGNPGVEGREIGWSLLGNTEINPVGIVSWNLISKERSSRTTYDYVYAATLRNLMGVDVTDFSADMVLATANAELIDGSISIGLIPADLTVTADNDTITLRVDMTANLPTTAFNGQMFYDTAAEPGQSFDFTSYLLLESNRAAGDINGDKQVDIEDLFIVGNDWLKAGSTADIMPAPNGDGIVNLWDYAVLAKNWQIIFD